MLTKTVLGTALNEETSDHLGYDKHAVEGRDGNSRNETRTKTVLTDNFIQVSGLEEAGSDLTPEFRRGAGTLDPPQQRSHRCDQERLVTANTAF